MSIEDGNWETKSGEKIHISDIPESHLANIITYLRARVTRAEAWIEKLTVEQQRRQASGVDDSQVWDEAIDLQEWFNDFKERDV